MARITRDFRKHPEAVQEWMLQNTWCDQCGAADLGMVDPVEYEENGDIFLEGNCRKCGSKVRSELREFNVDEA